MAERLEGTFWGYQDVELFYQVWRPKESVGTLVVTHGIAEHSECYARFAESLVEMGWTVFGWDLRGHGRSEGKRGYVNRFQDFSDDLDNAVRFVKTKYWDRQKPLVLFGHSMGGLITIKMLGLNAPAGIAALALSSPALGISLPVPKLKEKAAHILAEWLPKVTLYNEIKFDELIRDQNLVREYKADPLRHDKVSPRLFLGMVEAFSEAMTFAPEFHLPVIVQLAGHEKIVSTPASEKFFEALGSKKKELYIYSESFHEIFNDLDRQDALRDLDKFLKKIVSAGGDK
jgi:alpha-beta hydrolase superfamily lysophospholipase